MTTKEAIDKIKTLLNFSAEEAPAAEVPAAEPEAPAEVPADVPAEPEAPAEQPAEEPAPQVDFSAEIKVLNERIAQLEKQNAKFQSQAEEADKKSLAFAEAMNQTLALVEQIAQEPTGEPATEPKDTFLKQDKKSNLKKYFNNI
jgi:hypothetical protein